MRPLFLLLPVIAGFSLPQNMQIASGEASSQISSSQVLEVVASDQAILEWSSFNIEEMETARFIQPSEQASVVNRIFDASPSRIMGRLESNGQVVLLNQNGILVGKEAFIDVGSLIANALDSSIRIEGRVQSSKGDLHFAAPKIEGSGNLSAHDGAVSLIGANSVQFSGSISSKLSNQMGGEIKIFGELVSLETGAKLDASGDWGGGTILIGGDLRGKPYDFPNAKTTLVGEHVEVDVSAKRQGDGGKAVIWGDEATYCYGSVLAKGGEISGDGGLIEISGDWLDFRGTAETNSLNGKTGTLLLDPLDIVVTGAFAQQFVSTVVGPTTVITPSGSGTCITFPTIPFSTVPAGLLFPPPPLAPALPATYSILTAASLQAALAANHVVIDATGAAGGCSGIIFIDNTVNTVNLVWNTAHDLTLQAVSKIVVMGQVQNITANPGGNINLYCCGSLPVAACGTAHCTLPLDPCSSTATPCGATVGQIDVIASPQGFGLSSAYIGTQYGNIKVSSDANDIGCYPDVNIITPSSAVGLDLFARLGFQTTAGSPQSKTVGSITINCRNINIDAGVGPSFRFDGFIGSGDSTGNGAPNFDTATNITINATGNIRLHAQNGRTRIGNGGGFMGTGRQEGNITINCNGNIDLLASNNSNLCQARIGNGFDSNGTDVVCNGNIFVRANGNINMIAGNVAGGLGILGIGHTGFIVALNPFPPPYPGAPFPATVYTAVMQGDVDVLCGGSITMKSFNTANQDQRLFIGPQLAGPAVTTYCNIRVSVGLDLIMNAGNSRTFKIGFPDFYNGSNNYSSGPNPISVNVVVGRDLIMSSDNLAAAGTQVSPVSIGYGGTTPTDVYVAVGRNLSMTGSRGRSAPNISSNGNVYVAVNGNISLTANGTPSNNFANYPYIGNRDQSIATKTVIRAFGNITGTNASTQTPQKGFVIFGMGSPIYAAPVSRQNSLLMQAGGDIQFPSTFRTQTGSILIESDADLAAGSLWTSSGGFLTSVAGATLPTALNLCSIGASPVLSDSVAQAPDGLGAVSTNSGTIGGNIQLITTTGNITVHSAPQNTSATAADFVYDTAANTMLFTTTSGNIEVSGSNAQNAFRNITINTTMTTAGSIYVRANNDNTVNGAITSTGAGQPITLLSDADLTGTGDLNLAANVTSTDGPILLQAGDALGCFASGFLSSINQTAGTVSSGAGDLNANASYDINLSSSPLGFTASTGNLYTLTGHDTVLTNTTVQKTGGVGDLLMISGRNMQMINSNIDALPAIVTLVVDNCFPKSPLIGPGAFLMDGTSTIISDPGTHLRIFTALQNLNQILGLLNGTSFVPGTLFIDTANEVWCQYFSFPFPYPFFNLGTPYTIFYKNCLQAVAQQATVVVVELLTDLHPMNEFPGWKQEFWVQYSALAPELNDEPYYLRRRQLNILNHPKTWTRLLE
ncbi:MAG: filamentous hemagglutinin N-terminal domain-containing protein [Parachlamydiales bacterium]|nr:filamentous hemagglutinin N-terminal domain-containing protein [Parachlamydiales bacterium]